MTSTCDTLLALGIVVTNVSCNTPLSPSGLEPVTAKRLLSSLFELLVYLITFAYNVSMSKLVGSCTNLLYFVTPRKVNKNHSSNHV